MATTRRLRRGTADLGPYPTSTDAVAAPALASKIVPAAGVVKPDPAQVDDLANAINDAGTVTFMVGAGAAGARDDVLELARRLNAGDCWGAAAQFDRWVYAKGRRLPGLVKRRAEERRMFETGCESQEV